MKRIIVSAGGSGGHIIPALSIIKELQKRGFAILYIGNKNSMEEELVRNLNIDFEEIDVQKLYRKVTLAHLKFPFKLISSINKCSKIIKKFQPDAFLGTGGFVSGPAGYAAKKAKVPIFLQEQNSYPGLTTRLLSKYATNVFIGNKGAVQYLSEERCIFTGNPINMSTLEEKDGMDFQKFGMKQENPKLLLTGGSQGSVILNNALYEIIDRLLEEGIDVFWQVGRYSYNRFDALLKGKKGVCYFDFTGDIGKIYNSIDLVIARAGALSIAEFETKKIPAILIPLPTAAENHQYYNAVEMKDKGVAEIIEQKDLNAEILCAEIKNILNRKEKYCEAFGESVHIKAAEKIADIIDKGI